MTVRRRRKGKHAATRAARPGDSTTLHLLGAMMTAVPELQALVPVPAVQVQDQVQEVRALVQVKDDRRGAKVARADPAIGRRRPVDQVVPVVSVIDLRLLEVLVRTVDRVLAGQA